MKLCKGYIKIGFVLHPFFCYFLEDDTRGISSYVNTVNRILFWINSLICLKVSWLHGPSVGRSCDHYFQLRPIYTSENPTWVIVNRIFLMLYISKKILVSRFLIQTLCGNILLFCLIPWRIFLTPAGPSSWTLNKFQQNEL